jgi:hypothetical protein
MPLKDLPIPACVISFPTGRFVEFNDAFGELYHLDRQLATTFNTLFSELRHYERWVVELAAAHGATTNAERDYLDSHGKTRRVMEIARIIDPGETHQVAEVFHCEITRIVESRVRAEQELNAVKNILDLDDTNLGVIETTNGPNGTPEVTWVSLGLRTMLFDGQEVPLPFTIETIIPELKRHDEQSIQARQFLGKSPARNDHALYLTHEKTTIPVQRTEFLVPGPGNRLSSKWTSLRDARLPLDIYRILCTLGPNNPILEAVGVATFEKVFREFAHKRNPVISEDFKPHERRNLVFTKGNASFVHELINAGKINSSADILGKRDAELFPKDAASFEFVDRLVLDSCKLDQRTEEHAFPNSNPKSSLATVLKIPFDPDGKGQPIGLHAFYWETARTYRIFDALRLLYQPWNILKDVAFPVFCKDKERRLVYCNEAFAEDIRRITGNLQLTILDLVGMRDEDLHPKHLADAYRSADDAVLALQISETITRVEMHQWADGTERRVVVKKSRTETGIQGVFWFPDEEVDEESSRLQVRWDKFEVTSKDEVVGKFSRNQFDSLLTFFVLLKSSGSVVGYRDLFGEQKVGADLQHIKTSVAKKISRLKEIMRSYPNRLDELVEIMAVPNKGYQLTLRE